ncbi:tetratricopeptide repeat protein [Desulforhopalus sp. IMCC35007]|uniref:tetratricopeptide repeat protein n=1 Tax=Desulforhopalus sp. IMCC35007 TaxID=2569543 RepID=UPI00145F27DA|nr:tetratricopeptide repeat protein [Desulforhopalus sp. IMCC35007]
MKRILVLLLIFIFFVPWAGWLSAQSGDAKELLCEKGASALAYAGKVDEALAAIRQCIKKSPSRAKAHIVLGYLLLDNGDLQQAMASFEKALELQPMSSTAKTGKGIVLARTGAYAAAESILQEALKLNPDPARTYYELGLLYQQGGDAKKALTAFKEGIASYEQNAR